MKVTITGRHMTVHDSIKSYAEEKATKLERYFDQLRDIEIVFSEDGDKKQVEMIAHPRKGDRIVGQTSHDDMFAAIDLLVDKMYNQLHKTKEKLKERRKRSGRVPPPMGTPEIQGEQLDTYEDVVDQFSEKFDAK